MGALVGGAAVGPGVGEAVGLGEAVAVGLAVGDAVPVPVGVAVAAEMAKDKGKQISAVCARGALEGTLGATGCCLS